MVVQHNLQASNASRMLNITADSQQKSSEKLSSGYRINRAADDAAGLSISEKMRKQIRGLDQASTNASDGVSTVQTAEGALTEVHSMLQRMNELAVQAANGTNSESDRDALQNEIEQLTTEIDRIAETTKFNETYMLKGANGMSAMYVEAHDAGLKGTLVSNTTKGTFTMQQLKVGDQYTIGGVQYTIGASTNADAAKILTNDSSADDSWSNLAVGDTISINGITYTITKDQLNGGEEDPATNTIFRSSVKTLATAGSTVKYNGNTVKLFSAEPLVDGMDQADPTLITADAAYRLSAVELKAASSVGATKAAATLDKDGANEYKIDTTAGTVKFTINRGTVTIQNSLSFNLHVGSDADMTNKINIKIDAMDAASLGIKGLNVSDSTGKAATYAIDAIADALQHVSDQRASLGAIQNRLEHSIANLDNVVENTEAAESRIRDTDMADEMVAYSKNNILAQAGQSMLAQANQATQGVLSLLQ